MKLLAFLTFMTVIIACSDDPDDPRDIDCTALIESECLAESLCTAFYGRRIDPTAMCLGPAEMIVCGSAATTQCNNSIIGYVRAPTGTCWYQNAACFGPIPGYQGGSDFDGGDCPAVTEPCP